jgi:hypothetical protein
MNSNYDGCKIPGLTRNEEALLRTALAFVVVNARIKKRKLENIQDSTTNDLPIQQSREYAGTDSSTLDGNLEDNEGDKHSQQLSFMDRLFRASQATVGPYQSPNYLPIEMDKGRHMKQLFRVACGLANSFLRENGRPSTRKMKQTVPKRNKREDNGDDLLGIVSHLARQLQLFLQRSVYETTTSDSSRSSSLGLTFGTEVATASMSSKRKELPSKNKSKNSQQSPTSTTNETLSTMTPLHTWIHFSLLESMDKGVGTVQDDIYEMEAAFYVYEKMIPELGNTAPTLVNHIFHVCATIIRKLYDDEINFKKRPTESITVHKKILRCLAVSTLRLLGACWTARLLPSEGNKNQDLLLSELQKHLGDLLVPPSIRDFPKAFHEMSVDKKNSKIQFQVISTIGRGGRMKKAVDTNKTPSLADQVQRLQQQCQPIIYLDPQSKLMMRVSIYRLLLRM